MLTMVLVKIDLKELSVLAERNILARKNILVERIILARKNILAKRVDAALNPTKGNELKEEEPELQKTKDVTLNIQMIKGKVRAVDTGRIMKMNSKVVIPVDRCVLYSACFFSQ
jgi:hypothetical protein